MTEQILSAIKILNEGGIVIFPTDTAFGIGCRIDNEETIKKLFQIRKRPETQATPVLIANEKMAQDYLEIIPEDVKEKLIDKYWPGALTIVLPCQINKVPSLVRGGENNLGVRMPNHETTLEIIKGVGVPILGPSANFHGEKTPYVFEDLNPELVKLVDLVVPGKCSVKQPARLASENVAGRASTVVDCSVKPWKILRQGIINI